MQGWPHYRVAVTADFTGVVQSEDSDGNSVAIGGFVQVFQLSAADEDSAVESAGKAALTPTRPSGFPLEIDCGVEITEIQLAPIEEPELSEFLTEHQIQPQTGVYWRSGFNFFPVEADGEEE